MTAQASAWPFRMSLYPLEFLLAATPLSLQASARSKERWKGEVRTAARGRIRITDELGFLDRRPLALTIPYLPDRAMQGDIDNRDPPDSRGLRRGRAPPPQRRRLRGPRRRDPARGVTARG